MFSVKELREKRNKTVATAKAIMEKADSEKRNMTADENANVDKAFADVDEIDATMSKVEKLTGVENRSNGNRLANQVTMAAINEPQTKRDIVESAEYRSVFNKHLKALSKDACVLSEEERRTLAEGFGVNGYALVAQEYDKVIREKKLLANCLIGLCPEIVTHGNYNVPCESNIGQATFVGEDAPIPTADSSGYVNDPQVAQVTANAYGLKKIVQLSKELVQDANTDVMAYLGKNFGRAFGQAEFAAEIVGTGGAGMPTTQTSPVGLVNQVASGNVVNTASASGPTGDELVAWSETMQAQYQTGSIIIMPQWAKVIARKLKDGNGRYLWNDFGGGSPSTLFNYPVYICNYMPSGAGNDFALHFNPETATIFRRGGFEVQPLYELYAGNGMIGFRGWERFDFKVTDTNGLTSLVLHS
jgi:HK97 family phage major capsid protein